MEMPKKRKLSRKNAEDVYLALQKQRKRIKRRSIFLALFVLGVNAYAWFVFLSSASVNVKANVVSWDVNFLDENSPVKDMEIITEDLYPGMPKYQKTIKVYNRSDVRASFSFKVDSITVLGEETMNGTDTTEDAINYLKDTYPFIVTFDYDKTTLEKDDHLNFTINIEWPFEKGEVLAKDYYKLTKQYKYDPSVSYYSLLNGNYVEETISENDFNTDKTNLYLEKDDADSFWGSTCKAYKAENEEVCFKFHILLTVTQIGE